MAPRTSLACILTGPSRSAPDSDFIFLDGTLNQVQDRRGCLRVREALLALDVS